MTIRQVLTQYSFSHKFYILFSVSCARSVSNKTKDPAETNRCLDVVEAYTFGKATKEELEIVKTKLYAANAAAANAAYAAYNAADAAAAAYAATYATTTTAAATAAAYAADTAYAANKKILILMIKALSKLELEFIGIDKKLRLFMEDN